LCNMEYMYHSRYRIQALQVGEGEALDVGGGRGLAGGSSLGGSPPQGSRVLIGFNRFY
jgi:hypothetical protein